MKTLEFRDRDYYKEQARACLEILRLGTANYKTIIVRLNSAVQEGGLSLEEIDTNKKEIERLIAECCKINAGRWLNLLRSTLDVFQRRIIANRLRDEVKRGGFDFGVIGTSEEELNLLTS